MRKILSGTVVGVLLCVMAGSCESNDCMLNSSSYCYVVMAGNEGQAVTLPDTLSVYYHIQGYDSTFTYRCDTDTVVSTVLIDSLTAKGYELQIDATRKSRTVLNRQPNAGSLQLPLSYTAEEDTFILSYNSGRVMDTLWVNHQNLPYFTDMECGTIMHYQLTGVRSTRHLIDSVCITAPKVTNTLYENVKIYYTVSN